METRKNYILICALMIAVMLGTSVSWAQDTTVTKTKSVKPTVSAVSGVKVLPHSATSLKLSWNKFKGVSGYVIYKSGPSGTKFKKVKTLPANKTSWVCKKLKKDKIYKYTIRAFLKVDGKKVYSDYSDTVSAITATKKSKKVNVKSIDVDYVNRYLGLNKAVLVDASAVTPKGKKLISKKLTYTSSNPDIVTVDKDGWLQAQGKKGSAKVYIRAHNGVTKTLKIKVANYANPKKFVKIDKVRKWSKDAAKVLKKYKKEMCAIAAFWENNKEIQEMYYEDGNVQIVGGGVDLAPIDKALDKMLINTKVRFIQLDNRGYLEFKMKDGTDVYYVCFNSAGNAKKGVLKLAPCWFFYSLDSISDD